jgi:hypothetical protein
MATTVFIVVGLLFTVFAVVAVVSTIRGANKIVPEEPETKLSFTEKLAILNSK